MAHQRLASQERRRSSGSIEPEALRVWLLGGFRVSVGSRTIEPNRWRLRKSGSLLKLLALAEGHRLHRERIMATLWPELDVKRASNNFHRALHFARGALEPSAQNASSRYLPLRGDVLELCPDGPLWVDVEAFEEAARAARRTREPAAYRAAVHLYTGELLPEDLYEEWASERRDALRETYLGLVTRLAELYEEREEYDQAIEALRLALAEDPAREEAHRALMRLFAASGEPRRAIAQYQRLEKTLSERFDGLPAATTRRLYEQILEDRYLPRSEERLLKERKESASPRHNLPNARTSFVGREREIVAVKRSLAMTGLLTLTGTGGSGKTRLALEVARDLAGAYIDGVWLVELAPLSEPALVPNAVAAALDVRELPGQPLTDTLSNHLRAKQTLLVLDNCEHLIETTALLVDALLNTCTGLRVLATSREALGVAGETIWPLSPLSVPEAPERLPSAEELARYEAVGLFVERARSRLPGFELTGENARAIVEVCRRVEGIPLAIELAAARMGALAVEDVAQRLEDSLKLLTSGGRTAEPRHHTLRATLDWSHELLGKPEQHLFGRLSVFAGGWTLEAAEEVCSGSGIEQDGVLDLLSGLVDKSLVVIEAEAEGGLRYRMLEPVRQYAREKLRASREALEVWWRHAEYYLALAEAAEPELLGADERRWLGRLRTEIGNLRAALSWSLEPEEDSRERAEELRLRMAAALWRFWDVEGFQEGKEWLQRVLDKDPGGFPAVRAKALGGLGWILLFQQDYGPAIEVLEEAVALYKELGDLSGTGFALGILGYAVLHGRYSERVPAFVQEGEALMMEGLDGHTRAFLRMILATAALDLGDFDSAASQLKESLALCRELGSLRDTSMALFVLGMLEVERGNLDRGAPVLEEGAQISRELNDRLGSAYYSLGLGKVAFLRGNPVRAARLWGAAEALREQMGMSLSTFDLDHSGYEQDLARARSSVDERTWAASWAEGRALAPDHAIEYALSADEPAPRAAKESDRPALTRREEEVALLVARGLTNSRIAEELSISARTVDTHVGRILKKLGLHSREQVTDRLEQRQQHEAG
jgi:predicted ATPase/DNA-binding SARP family transcriptional activator/DNA-binding CsgD family transcriptional regulator